MKARVLLVIFYVFVVVNCSVPDYIKVCEKKDPHLEDCIRNSIYALVPRLKVGIPDLNIPGIEPLHINDVALNTGNEAARINANLTDIQIWDASNFTILELTPNVEKNTFRFKVVVPKVRLEGRYEIDSKILFLELRGKGPLHINITDYLFDCTLRGHKVKKNHEHHLLFEKMRCEIEFAKGSILLEDLFNGDPTIGRATNDVINDNLDAFFREIKPNLEEALSTTFTDISNKITDKFNYNELFL